MIAHHRTLFSFVLPVVFAAPWIVGSIVLWIGRPRDGHIPPSFADLMLRR